MAICDAFKTRRLVMVFSNNPQKDPAEYETLEHRLELGEVLKDHYKDRCYDISLSDIEQKIKSNKTWNVLQALQDLNPDARLIWSMGADAMAGFHTWYRAEDIARHFSMAVIDRPSDTEAALASPLAQKFNRAASPDELILRPPPGWVFLPALTTHAHLRSRDLRKLLKEGQREFDGPFQKVADRIRQKGYYGVPGGTAP